MNKKFAIAVVCSVLKYLNTGHTAAIRKLRCIRRSGWPNPSKESNDMTTQNSSIDDMINGMIDRKVGEKFESLSPLIEGVKLQGGILKGLKGDMFALKEEVAAMSGQPRAEMVRALNAALAALGEGIDAHAESRKAVSVAHSDPSAESVGHAKEVAKEAAGVIRTASVTIDQFNELVTRVDALEANDRAQDVRLDDHDTAIAGLRRDVDKLLAGASQADNRVAAPRSADPVDDGPQEVQYEQEESETGATYLAVGAQSWAFGVLAFAVAMLVVYVTGVVMGHSPMLYLVGLILAVLGGVLVGRLFRMEQADSGLSLMSPRVAA